MHDSFRVVDAAVPMSEIGARCCPAAFAKSSLTAIGPEADRPLLASPSAI